MNCLKKYQCFGANHFVACEKFRLKDYGGNSWAVEVYRYGVDTNKIT